MAYHTKISEEKALFSIIGGNEPLYSLYCEERLVCEGGMELTKIADQLNTALPVVFYEFYEETNWALLTEWLHLDYSLFIYPPRDTPNYHSYYRFLLVKRDYINRVQFLENFLERT